MDRQRRVQYCRTHSHDLERCPVTGWRRLHVRSRDVWHHAGACDRLLPFRLRGPPMTADPIPAPYGFTLSARRTTRVLVGIVIGLLALHTVLQYVRFTSQ